MNIQETITSSHHHQSNWQVEACIKFLMCIITNALTLIKTYIIALLQIYSVLKGAGLASPPTMLFNGLIRGLLHQMNRDPINLDNGDLHHEALKAHRGKSYKGKDTEKNPIFVMEAGVAVQ